ncbi:Enolase 1 [Morus notabilis]|uniref:phosphopyruvate hydratase n=1 Tax=Morus notabilis TaxID=981085 RepID=W9QVF2_9ROSA|nr:Enolase 1 [Morus notabilis]
MDIRYSRHTRLRIARLKYQLLFLAQKKDSTDQAVFDKLIVKARNNITDHVGSKFEGIAIGILERLVVNMLFAVSAALCKMVAEAKKIPLYRYIAKLVGERMRDDLPIPALNGIGVIADKFGAANNEGAWDGYTIDIEDIAQGSELLNEAINKSGNRGRADIGVRVAASEFYGAEDKLYHLNFKKKRLKKAIKEETFNALLLKGLFKIGNFGENQERRAIYDWGTGTSTLICAAQILNSAPKHRHLGELTLVVAVLAPA